MDDAPLLLINLSLEIDPKDVDVNVHPTKRQVHFLDEDAITERICDVIQQGLFDQGRSRVFATQVLSQTGSCTADSERIALDSDTSHWWYFGLWKGQGEGEGCLFGRRQ